MATPSAEQQQQCCGSGRSSGGPYVPRLSDTWRIDINYAFPSPTATLCCSCLQCYRVSEWVCQNVWRDKICNKMQTSSVEM